MALPQRIAGIPEYLPSNSDTAFKDAAPGHRFLLYFRNWQGNGGTFFEPYKGKVQSTLKVDKNASPAEKQAQKAAKQREEEELKAHFDDIPGQVCKFNDSALKQLQALRRRQQVLIATYGADGFRIEAISTAPFATGLGNEHPIENGFAFLTPYGLPYLAGSGVKGVLRQAAEDLALFPEDYGIIVDTAPTLLDVWWLFGFEGAQSRNGPAAAIFDPGSAAGRVFQHCLPALAARQDLHDFIRMALADDPKNRAYYLDDRDDRRPAFLQRLLQDDAFRQSIHTRGALDCWDVFPAPPEAGPHKDSLVVEIMTPHHGTYYQGPNAKREVLAIYPKGAPPHNAESPTPVPFLAVPAGSSFDFHITCAGGRLPNALRATWQARLERVFAHAFEWLGFGAKTAVGYGAMADQSKGGLENPEAAKPAPSATEEIWPSAKLAYNPGSGEIVASNGKDKTSGMRGNEVKGFLDVLGEQRARTLKAKRELKNVPVRVQREGNMIRLLGLAEEQPS